MEQKREPSNKSNHLQQSQDVQWERTGSSINDVEKSGQSHAKNSATILYNTQKMLNID